MVRFSDLLGGSGDPEDARPTTVATPRVEESESEEPEPEREPDPGDDSLAAFAIDDTPTTPGDSPQDVLDRLTQYATSARAGDQVPDVPGPAPDASAEVPTADEAAQEFTPVGDDLLPSSGTTRKSGRGRKRRP